MYGYLNICTNQLSVLTELIMHVGSPEKLVCIALRMIMTHWGVNNYF